MNPKLQAWTRHPVRTGYKVAMTYVRRAHPVLSEVVVPFDDGRSRIVANLQTSLGLGLYRYGDCDPDLGLLRDLLSPGDIFIDGGANVGLFTLVAAARVGKSGKVIAFEPAGATRQSLVRNVFLNRFSWVEIRAEALGDCPGTAELIVFGGNGSGLSSFAPASSESGETQSVPLTTLDLALKDLPSDRVRLIKLDLEGTEYNALLGAKAVLQRCSADLLVEIENDHLQRQGSSADKVWNFLKELGYRGRALNRGTPNVLFSRDTQRLDRFAASKS